MARQIRDLVERAQKDPSTEHLEDLWRAVFMRKGWYFLPAEQREGPNRPAVMMIDDQPWLVAFTSLRHLKAFARNLGRIDDDEQLFLLVLDPLESMQKILEVREQVRGVVFNPDSPAAFRAPVAALEGYARHFGVPLDEL